MSVAKHLLRFTNGQAISVFSGAFPGAGNPRGVASPVSDEEPDLNRDRKKTNHNPFDLAPYQGLPSQYLSILLVRSYRTFAPLPTVRAVRELSLHFKLAVFFCGTILAIARTGRYPASLVFRKPGLSSN